MAACPPAGCGSARSSELFFGKDMGASRRSTVTMERIPCRGGDTSILPPDHEPAIVTACRAQVRVLNALVVPVLITLVVAVTLVLHDVLSDELARRRGVMWASGTAIASTIFAAVLVLGPGLLLLRAVLPVLKKEFLRRACRRYGIDPSTLSESIHLL